ncbi:MAG: ferritin family protein [Candidatus Aminicenantes bacterium]|nr:MAG: ferritin family protein [Candidatus Aminicenantes bacterium]
MLDVSTAPAKELLAMAVKAEMDANQTYSDIAGNLSNPLLKEKFQWLAYEENKHKEILEKLFTTMNPGEEIPIPDTVDEDLLPSIHLTPDSSLAEIIFQAMESEKSAENFYAALTQRVKEAQKKILEYLSKVEHSHYMMLKSEYALAQEFEDYAEKDIDKVIT